MSSFARFEARKVALEQAVQLVCRQDQDRLISTPQLSAITVAEAFLSFLDPPSPKPPSHPQAHGERVKP